MNLINSRINLNYGLRIHIPCRYYAKITIHHHTQWSSPFPTTIISYLSLSPAYIVYCSRLFINQYLILRSDSSVEGVFGEITPWTRLACCGAGLQVIYKEHLTFTSPTIDCCIASTSGISSASHTSGYLQGTSHLIMNWIWIIQTLGVFSMWDYGVGMKI